jgi:membrane-associated protein
MVITPFLPGDSLIFATGAPVASGSLNLLTLLVVLCLAAVAGDSVNYQIGHLLRKRVANQEDI